MKLFEDAGSRKGRNAHQFGSVLAKGAGEGLRLSQIEPIVRAGFEPQVLFVVAVVVEHEGEAVAFLANVGRGLLDQAVFGEEDGGAVGERVALLTLGTGEVARVLEAVFDGGDYRLAGLHFDPDTVGGTLEALLGGRVVVFETVFDFLGF